MTQSNIIEVLRELECQFQEKKAILNYHRKNELHKAEVERMISNNGWNLKPQESGTGNIWGNCENLRENIQKMDKEISLYEDLNKPKNRLR